MEQWWERARRAMKAKGITQSQAAEHFDMTPAGMQKWLSGAREPSVGELLKMADFLKMSRSELVLGTQADDDISDLPDFAREPLRRIASTVRRGALDADWFQRFELALEALDGPSPVAHRRLDYRSAALGVASAMIVKEKTKDYIKFIQQVDQVIRENEPLSGPGTSPVARQPDRAQGENSPKPSRIPQRRK